MPKISVRPRHFVFVHHLIVIVYYVKMSFLNFYKQTTKTFAPVIWQRFVECVVVQYLSKISILNIDCVSGSFKVRNIGFLFLRSSKLSRLVLNWFRFYSNLKEHHFPFFIYIFAIDRSQSRNNRSGKYLLVYPTGKTQR